MSKIIIDVKLHITFIDFSNHVFFLFLKFKRKSQQCIIPCFISSLNKFQGRNNGSTFTNSLGTPYYRNLIITTYNVRDSGKPRFMHYHLILLKRVQ